MPPRSSRSSIAPTVNRQEIQLPAYQSPSAPLNPQGLSSLQRLQNQDAQKKLNDHFKIAIDEIGQSAYNVTSTLANQEQWVAMRKEKYGEEDQKYKSRIPLVDALSEKVNALNSALERKIREVIDAQSIQQTRQDALKEISINATRSNGRSTIDATQSTLGASQFRSIQNQDVNEDEESAAEGITPDAGPGIPTVLKQKLDEGDQKYSQLSLAQRYAEHNDYIQFRKSMHDGKHSAFDEDAQPVMPHANTWFDTDGPTFARGSQDGPNTEHDDQNDSDVEAVAENVNIKCPLTLLVMTDPVKSRKCPHNFERSAIESMLLHSTTRTNGRSGQKSVKCPVCEVLLTADDLVPDAALKRRIDRKAVSQTRIDQDTDDEGNDHRSNHRGMIRAQSVDSQLEPDLHNFTQIKNERVSGLKNESLVPATQFKQDEDDERNLRPPISTAEVVDLDMGDDNDEE